MVEKSPKPAWQSRPRALIALCVLLLVSVLLIHFGMKLANHLVSALPVIGAEASLPGVLIIALLLYAVLIAIPFMPGIEVGIGLLMLQGASIAPFVYLATVCGLLFAYGVGRCLPVARVARLFAFLGLHRAANYMHEADGLSPDARLAKQQEVLPDWLAKLTVDYRYITIAVLLNVPGTFAIGGGGGILIAAGLSRVFRTRYIILTLALATLPVPLAVWVSGTWLF